ncbi:helix-turn-helix domain-containing protein [Tepidibacter mesophilus]|uniref:helix-turn-helix domain-containing protein n=1 Tax=Tepidibacter mesophilus TaxID=655607 RepID=UPI001651A151|nr:helix-turn-helix domain-containing protein [Tepidibacter mesophilus]
MTNEKQLAITKQGATEVMKKLAEDEYTKLFHEYFVQIPHKLLRCINISLPAKFILFDIIAYMGNKNHAYPSIEDLAFNCGASHITVQNHIKELEDKKILRVERKHNNTYFIYDELRMNGYIILSEVLHAYRSKMKEVKNVSERTKNQLLRGMLCSDVYQEALEQICGERQREKRQEDKGDNYVPYQIKSAVDSFKKAVEAKIMAELPQVYSALDFEDVAKFKERVIELGFNRKNKLNS